MNTQPDSLAQRDNVEDEGKQTTDDKTRLIDKETNGNGQTSRSKDSSSLEKMRIRLASLAYTDSPTSTGQAGYGDTTDLESDNDGHGTIKNKDKQYSDPCCRMTTPVVILFTLCLLIVLGFALLAIVLKIRLEESYEVCHSSDCAITSGLMLSKMGLDTDRCEDFHQYACAEFNRDELRPPDRSDWNVFSQTAQITMSLIRSILQTNGWEYRGFNSTAIEKAKHFYRTCLNDTSRDLEGTGKLVYLIKTLGSWPLDKDSASGGWVKKEWSFENAIATTFSLGFTPFFDITIDKDFKNNTINMIQVDQARLMLPSEDFYLDQSVDTYHQAYISFFKDVVLLLGAKETDAEVYAEDVWQLEKAIAASFVSRADRVDIRRLYNVMTIEGLQEIINGMIKPPHRINMTLILKKYLHSNISQSERILVAVPEYFRKMGSIVENVKLETLATYVVWTAVRSMVSYSGSDYEKAVTRLQAVLTGISTTVPRWDECTSQSSVVHGFSVGALYVEKYFTLQDKKFIESIVHQFIQEFSSQLSNMEWMDKITRERARDKALAIEYKVGYPDFIMDPGLLDAYYAKLEVTDSIFDSVLSYKKFVVDRNIAKLGQASDRDEWFDTPTDTNAYYTPLANQIVLPAGILQKPFYHSSYPMSVIFGAIGFVIGHELTHGFDNTGRKFDKFGNMMDWWGNDSATEFEKRSECFRQEYDGFIVNGHHLNGLITLGENIADNGGIKLSYAAYKSWLKSTKEFGKDKLLPSLNMTRPQQFFLSMAQVWCGSSTKEKVLQNIFTNPHSYSKYRVNGVVQNFPEFSSSFHCSTNAALNVKQRCNIW